MEPSKSTLTAVRRAIRSLGDPARARFAERYFKTGPGEYAEGDRFVGLTAAQARSIVKQHRDLSIVAAEELLQSLIHEDRAIALLILCERHRRHPEERQTIFDVYLRNTAHINNWDLVDLSAEHIVGAHLFPRGGPVLTRLARSRMLWERRIALLATFYFIRKGQFREPLRITRLLLKDEHDLIHKAAGWMLREIGKRDPSIASAFLDRHAAEMPRTMLRYAVERFDPSLRRRYMDARRIANTPR